MRSLTAAAWYVSKYRTMKCHDISISWLGCNMNPSSLKLAVVFIE